MLGLLAVAALAGCGGSGNSPFAAATPTDREFVAAAVTWDLNKDGDVTCDEWKQYAANLFRDADANRDGVLTREEFVAMSRQDRLFEMAGFAYFDADGDGRISLAELTEKPNPAFALLDKNGDCVIAPDERMQSRGGRHSEEKSSPGAAPPTGRRRNP